MGISRDHLEKIELKLKTERGWRDDGLTVSSACGSSGDTNFTPHIPLFGVSQQLAAPAPGALECPPSPLTFFLKGVFSRPKGGHGFVFAGMRV